MSVLSGDWRSVSLGEVCQFTGGNGFREELQGQSTGDYPFVKVSDMGLPGNKRLILEANNWIDEKTRKGEAFKTFPRNSIIFAKVGAALLLNRRRILTRKTCIDNNMMAAVPHGIEYSFLFYLLSSIDFADFVQSGAVPSINQSQMSGIQFYFPPKPEQTQIAEILTTVDQAIEQTEALIAKQQRIKTGLMQDLLTRGIDEHGNLRSEQTHQFKDSPLGRIPVEWETIQIGNVASLQSGYDITESELCDGPYPVVSSSGIVGYHCEYTSNGPNVVVGRKGTIGKVHYLETDFWAHDTSLYVTNFYGNSEKYFYYLFTHLDLIRYGTKSGSPSLNRNDIHPLWVGLPKPIEQDRISTILMACDHQTNSFVSNMEKAKQLKTALMQDLLTGKVRVTPLLDKEEKTAE